MEFRTSMITTMKKGITTGLFIAGFSATNGTLLWAISWVGFGSILTWPQCWMICAMILQLGQTVRQITECRSILDKKQELEATSRSAVSVDGRTFATPLEASLHLLWVIQRLSYYEPHREGQPADGPRIREVIRESRKLIDQIGYLPGKPLPNVRPLAPADTQTPNRNGQS